MTIKTALKVIDKWCKHGGNCYMCRGHDGCEILKTVRPEKKRDS